jgi:hypothetical protein
MLFSAGCLPHLSAHSQHAGIARFSHRALLLFSPCARWNLRRTEAWNNPSQGRVAVQGNLPPSECGVRLSHDFGLCSPLSLFFLCALPRCLDHLPSLFRSHPPLHMVLSGPHEPCGVLCSADPWLWPRSPAAAVPSAAQRNRHLPVRPDRMPLRRRKTRRARETAPRFYFSSMMLD